MDSQKDLKPFPNVERRTPLALLTCEQMRRAEELTFRADGKSMWDLMLRAGQAVAHAVKERYMPCRVLVLCGTGNNGGDGYVAAHTLRQLGWSVTLCALGPATAPEAKQAAVLWAAAPCSFSPDFLQEADVVIDALFGTGLTRNLEGEVAQIVQKVTASKLPVVAADMPSGINGDTGAVMGCAIPAEFSVTFGWKKRGHVLLPGKDYCGTVVVADTGMNAQALKEVGPSTFENDETLWLPYFPVYQPRENKYHHGHLLVFGGRELTGAARLAARAGQRIAAGLVTVTCPSEVWPIYATSLEGIMVTKADNLQKQKEIMEHPKISALAMGMGLGLEDVLAGRRLVLEALATKKPMVLDADAMTYFKDNPHELFESLHENCVLTPHEGEFSRLFSRDVDMTRDKVTRASESAQKAGCIVVLKGSDTVISAPNGQNIVNSGAPPWLAKAGSGDVLSGMIAGLLTSGMPTFAAACAGVAIHSMVAHRLGAGLIPSDLVNAIPAVLQEKTA
ncbi:MAG: NAD(P)H-hydrate dehydratase [Alphaproteobacteria bacterium]|jgi:NAD(P)H-hydrate epimerase|nr:NAD(P)H-hydrate dehydratase [Alphaproteobacteria bacterium]